MQETKKEKFVRLAENRTNKVLEMIRLIGNLANKSVYDYTAQDVEKIFKAIETETALAKKQFTDIGGPDKFKLIQEEYIDDIIKGNEVLVLNNLNYSLLPKINIQWNDWLVYSVINKWSNKYKVMMSSSQFRYSVPIIYRLEEEPKDLEELLNIIKNKRGFDDTQMANYMKERNLVF